MSIELIGWDIGGAHLKAAALHHGQIVAIAQRACPLWRGMEHLHAAVASILEEFAAPADCWHAITMTGELVDLFDSREHGVQSLVQGMKTHAAIGQLCVFAGSIGFLPADAVGPEHVVAIASANWLATGSYLARRVPSGLLVDIGSTTADLLILDGGDVKNRGYTDHERLRCEELVYTGVVRTSLMALAERVPFGGEWLQPMAEHFATTADIYRLTGELPEHADQADSADGGAKTQEASRRRLARMLGLDVNAAEPAAWVRLAGYFRECQLNRMQAGCARQLSRGLLASDAPWVGAGVGRFLVQELAHRFGHPYLDFIDVFPCSHSTVAFSVADCAPAAAVACLAGSRI